MSPADAFAEQLDELMTEQHLDAAAIAVAFRDRGVTAVAVQEWRDGLRTPCPRHLSQLLEILGVPRSRLLPL